MSSNVKMGEKAHPILSSIFMVSLAQGPDTLGHDQSPKPLFYMFIDIIERYISPMQNVYKHREQCKKLPGILVVFDILAMTFQCQFI